MKPVLEKPGFNLKPAYDLPKTREVRSGHKRRSAIGELNLASMIDMFVVIVIFLLMNFSATGEIFYIQKDLKLPSAINSQPIDTAPLITIGEKEVTLHAEKVGDNPLTVTETDVFLPKLADALRQIRIFEETLRPGEPFKGQVNIQADENTALIYIKRVMQTCITEGWTGINFITRPPESPTPVTEI